MRLNLGSVAGDLPIAYFPSVAAHTQLLSPYYNEEEIIASLVNFESMNDEKLYEATSRAQGALLHWQNEFYELDNQIYRAAKGSYQREHFFGIPRPRITTTSISTKAVLSQANNNSTRGDLTIEMNDVPEPDELPAKRIRKATKFFETPSAPVTTTTTKRKRQEPDIVESIETAHLQPAKKRAARAPKIKSEASVAPESSKQASARSIAEPAPEAPTPPLRRPARARPVTKPASQAPEPTARRSARAKSAIKASSAIPEATNTRVSKPSAPSTKRCTKAKSATEQAPPAAPQPTTKRAPAALTQRSATATSATERAPSAAVQPIPAAPKKRSVKPESAIKHEPSATPEVSRSGGKDTKRSAAMKAAWAKRKAEGRNGRNGGAPVKSTVAKTGGEKGGK